MIRPTSHNYTRKFFKIMHSLTVTTFFVELSAGHLIVF